ncbi:MAG: GntR family transcriptional regulator [Candidatus Hydrogenedentes bacterium]|nr:GntR family transcriptional regulator [Candidatus Hydrogenedentota bacterium]
MLEKVNLNSSVAVYVQIENQVRFAVAAGKLKADDQLPSVRELSERLEVNPNTVSKACRDLEVMGIVYTRRGMGIYIQKGAEARCRSAVRTQVIEKLYEVVGEALAAGFSHKEMGAIADKLCHAGVEPYAIESSLVRSLTKV